MTEVDPARSKTMRAVRSKDTGPEVAVRRLAHSLGYRFRLHRKDLPGTPDIVFPKHRKVIFVRGCFWHGHDCPRGGARQRRTQNIGSRKWDETRRVTLGRWRIYSRRGGKSIRFGSARSGILNGSEPHSSHSWAADGAGLLSY